MLAQVVFGTKATTSTTLRKLVSLRMEAALLHWTELILNKEEFKAKNYGHHDPSSYDIDQITRYNVLVRQVAEDRKAAHAKDAEAKMVALYKEQMEGQAHHAAAPVNGEFFDVDVEEESQ